MGSHEFVKCELLVCIDISLGEAQSQPTKHEEGDLWVRIRGGVGLGLGLGLGLGSGSGLGQGQGQG